MTHEKLMDKDLGLRLRRARNAWRVMKRRCLEPAHQDYPRYGGAGVTAQDSWITSFPAFLGDVGLPPTSLHWLGRLNTGGSYTPSNVIWTLRIPQLGRRRCARHVTLNGTTPTIAEAARLLGLRDMTLRRRLLEQGRPLREAVYAKKLARQDSMLLTHRGLTLPLPTWARLLHIKPQRLWARIRQGWSVERALTAPVRPRRGTRKKKAQPTTKLEGVPT